MNIAVSFSGHTELSRNGSLFKPVHGMPDSYYTFIFGNISSSLPCLRFFTLDQVSLSTCRALMIVDLPSRRSSLNSLLYLAEKNSLPVILVLMESFLGRGELFNARNLRFANTVLTYDVNYCHFLRTFGIKAFCYLLPSVDRSFSACGDEMIFDSAKTFSFKKSKAVFVGGKKALGFLDKETFPYFCLSRGWRPSWLSRSLGTKPLSNLRNQLVRSTIKNDLPIDIFGSGWPYGSIAKHDGNKTDLLCHYRASICIENCVADGYITEKIVDALIAGAFPIYSGTNSVYRLIPADLFIKADRLSDILCSVEYVLSLDSSSYVSWYARCLDFVRSSSLKSFRYFDLAAKINYVISTL